MRYAPGIVAALAAVLLGGCGYTTQSTLDEQYQTIFVSAFQNQSSEYDLQAPLTNAVSRKFITDTRLRLADPDDADLILEGVILDYSLKGLTFDENDDVSQYLLVITAGVRLSETATGDVLWEDRFVSGETTYYAQAAGQSSDRLRGNAEVYLPSVRAFATEEENRGASEALEQLASDIFYRTVEPW